MVCNALVNSVLNVPIASLTAALTSSGVALPAKNPSITPAKATKGASIKPKLGRDFTAVIKAGGLPPPLGPSASGSGLLKQGRLCGPPRRVLLAGSNPKTLALSPTINTPLQFIKIDKKCFITKGI